MPSVAFVTRSQIASCILFEAAVSYIAPAVAIVIVVGVVVDIAAAAAADIVVFDVAAAVFVYMIAAADVAVDSVRLLFHSQGFYFY